MTSTILSSPSVAPTTKIIMESVVDAVVVAAVGSSNSTDFFDNGVVGGVEGMEEDVVEESDDEDLFSQYYVALVIDYTIMMSFTWLGMYICVRVQMFVLFLCLSILFG